MHFLELFLRPIVVLDFFGEIVDLPRELVNDFLLSDSQSFTSLLLQLGCIHLRLCATSLDSNLEEARCISFGCRSMSRVANDLSDFFVHLDVHASFVSHFLVSFLHLLIGPVSEGFSHHAVNSVDDPLQTNKKIRLLT